MAIKTILVNAAFAHDTITTDEDVYNMMLGQIGIPIKLTKWDPNSPEGIKQLKSRHTPQDIIDKLTELKRRGSIEYVIEYDEK